MRHAKKVGIALAALLAIVLALPYLISAEKFRPAIENRLQAALGRRVQFGDLTFRLIPLSLRATALKVEGLGTVELLDVRARLLPLLSGDVEIDSLILTRPVIAYTAAKSSNSTAELPAAIEIIDGKLTLTNASRERSEYSHIDADIHTAGPVTSGTLSWKNGTLPINLKFSASDKANVWTVSQLDAAVGALTATFTGAIDANASTVNGALVIKPSPLAGLPLNSPYKPTGTLSAEVKISGPLKQPALTGAVHLANLEVSGGALRQPLRATALQLALTPSQITAKPFSLQVGPTLVQAAFQLSDYTGKPVIDANVSTKDAALPDLLAIARVEDVTATGTATFQVHAVGPIAKPKLSGAGSLSGVDLRTPALRANLKVDTAQIKFEEDAAALENAILHIGKSTGRGSLRIRDFDHPDLALTLDVDQLSNTEMQSWLPESKGASSSSSKLSVTGNLSIGKMHLNDLLLENVKTGINLKDQLLTLDPLTAGVYGGRLAGSATVNLKPQPAVISMKTHLEKIESQQLLSATTPLRNVLSGPLSADAQLQFSPKPGEDFARTLTGNVQFQLAQGKLIPFNVLGELNALARFLKPAAAAAASGTSFLGMKGEFQLSNGVAETKDLRLDLDRASALFTGTVNLADQSLNLRMLTTMNKQLSEEVGGSKIGGFLTAAFASPKGELLMPSLVRGTFSKPVFAPDPVAAGKLKLNSATGIQEGVQGIMDMFRPKKKQD